MAKGIMRRFKLREISAVDFPAQGDAKFAIAKRRDDAAPSEAALPAPYIGKVGKLPDGVVAYAKRGAKADLAKTGAALPDGSFGIENRADIRNASRLVWNGAHMVKARAHIIDRANALGAAESLPADWRDGTMTFKATRDLTNDEAVAKFSQAVEAFIAEQTDAGVENDVAVAKAREFANALVAEVDVSVSAMQSVFAEIEKDAAETDKDGALQKSFCQFKAHIQGITADGIENAVVKAALQEAGFKVTEGGTLAKSGDSEMGVDLKKFLGLPATATDADVEKALKAREDAANLSKNMLKLSASHLAYIGKAQAAGKMTEAQVAEFVAKSDTDRAAYMKANPFAPKKPADPTADPDADEDEDCPPGQMPMGKRGEDFLVVEGETIRKSDVGASAFAIIKAQTASIEKLADESAINAITKRVEPLSYIGKADEVAGLLHSIHKLGGKGPEIAKAVEAKFTSLNEVIVKGVKDGKSIFTEIGKGGGNGGGADAKTEIETLAQKMVTDGKARNIFKARDLVRTQNPELAKREQDEKKAA